MSSVNETLANMTHGLSSEKEPTKTPEERPEEKKKGPSARPPRKPKPTVEQIFHQQLEQLNGKLKQADKTIDELRSRLCIISAEPVGLNISVMTETKRGTFIPEMLAKNVGVSARLREAEKDFAPVIPLLVPFIRLVNAFLAGEKVREVRYLLENGQIGRPTKDNLPKFDSVTGKSTQYMSVLGRFDKYYEVILNDDSLRKQIENLNAAIRKVTEGVDRDSRDGPTRQSEAFSRFMKQVEEGKTDSEPASETKVEDDDTCGESFIAR